MNNQIHNIRKSQFAGSFYPSSSKDIIQGVASFFKDLPIQLESERVKSVLTLLPHAGHIYSGAVTAKTIAEVEFASRIIILCPNHKGLGKNYALWPNGAWINPIGQIPIDGSLSDKLVESGIFCYDEQPHLAEHSIEVILPFLQYSVPILYIVPISVANLEQVEAASDQLAKIIKEEKENKNDISILVSSDMNHFANDAENRRKDNLALEAFLSGDIEKLIHVVNKEKISMCGVIPAILGLLTAQKLGVKNSKLAAYDTSATASNDSSRVVGYAGAYFW